MLEVRSADAEWVNRELRRCSESGTALCLGVFVVSSASAFLLPWLARRRRSRHASPAASPPANRAANQPADDDTNRLGSRVGSHGSGPTASHLPKRPGCRNANRPQNRREDPSANLRHNPLRGHPGNRSGNGSPSGSRGVDFSLSPEDNYANMPWHKEIQEDTLRA
jgi:hypothetical protein